MLKRTFRGMPWRSRFRFPNNAITARPTPFFLRARQKKMLFSLWRREGCKPLTRSVVDYFGVINPAATRLEPDRQSGAPADHAVSDFFSVHGFAPGRPMSLATAALAPLGESANKLVILNLFFKRLELCINNQGLVVWQSKQRTGNQQSNFHKAGLKRARVPVQNISPARPRGDGHSENVGDKHLSELPPAWPASC